MKVLLIFAVLAAIAHSQIPDPVPIPALDLGRVKGQWWVGVAYNSTFNNNQPPNITCWSWDISFDNKLNDLVANETYYLNGEFQQSLHLFDVSQDAEWTEADGQQYVWIAMDPKSYSWGTFASEYYQYAYLFNRNTNFSQKLLYDERVLLNLEGYKINDTNFYMIDNSNCSNSSYVLTE